MYRYCPAEWWRWGGVFHGVEVVQQDVARSRCGSKKVGAEQVRPSYHHERAQIPYPGITGMCLAPDIKISGHIHGRPKCQINLKLPCSLSLPLPPQIFYATGCWNDIYGHLWSIMSDAMRCSVRPACEGTYGFVRFSPYSAATGLYGHILVWSHMVPSLWHCDQPIQSHMAAYSSFPMAP